jgi:hypothetical protein
MLEKNLSIPPVIDGVPMGDYPRQHLLSQGFIFRLLIVWILYILERL